MEEVARPKASGRMILAKAAGHCKYKLGPKISHRPLEFSYSLRNWPCFFKEGKVNIKLNP